MEQPSGTEVPRQHEQNEKHERHAIIADVIKMADKIRKESGFSHLTVHSGHILAAIYEHKQNIGYMALEQSGFSIFNWRNPRTSVLATFGSSIHDSKKMEAYLEDADALCIAADYPVTMTSDLILAFFNDPKSFVSQFYVGDREKLIDHLLRLKAEAMF